MTSSKKDKDIISSRKDREREKAEKERAAVTAGTERLKTVVRRLPPNLPEGVFWQSVQQWVSDDSVTWKAFCPGKLKKKINKENIPSRAYIAFKNEELLAQFSRDYDGHVFRDKQGNESQAIVEFAPYQKIPVEKKKFDARNASIENDEDYISFVASLNEAANAEPLSMEALIAANQPPPMPKTTPLLEALKAEKSATKDKEAILRNHAHYKDVAVLSSVSAVRSANIGPSTVLSTKDDGGKKKGASAVQQKEAAQPETGKKGKKAQAMAAKQQHQYQHQQHPTVPGVAKKERIPSPKLARAARQQAAAAKAAVAAQVAIQLPAQTSGQSKPIDAPPMSASSSDSSGTAANMPAPTATVAAQLSAAAAAPRKGRPIVGLATRQLQAALNQVGAAAIERKRREREKEAVKEGNPADGGASERGKEPELVTDILLPSAVSPEPPAHKEKPKAEPPPSPRRDRRKKERGPYQHNAGPKVPSIMQRPDGVPPPALQRDAPGQVLPGPAQVQAPITPGDNASSGPVGGHPPRGSRRGRSRGRGGAIHRGG
ncbi:hypothetical protein APHAL10511_004634 [Amanita phalloides]|nr:hypothetical protein APHAL10511_004634 [Amanita phalloides]